MGAGGGGDRRLRGRMGRVGEWMKRIHVREKKENKREDEKGWSIDEKKTCKRKDLEASRRY